MKKVFGEKTEQIAMWIMTLLAILFCFLFMLYGDNLINSNTGYCFIDSIFTGKLRDFFNGMDWSYGISIYFIYAIWSIPVWIFNQFRGNTIDMQAIPVLLWYKLLLVLFAMWSVWLVAKIAKRIDANRVQQIALQYVSSFFFIFPVFAIAQCDIIGLCFVLLGVYYYIQEKNAKFLLSFAIAATMKYFAIFVFIPLILFRYRKLNKTLQALLAGLVFVLCSLAIVSQSTAGREAMGNEEFYVNRHILYFASTSIDMGAVGQIGLLAFFYCILCIAAYTLPNNDKEKNIRTTIWLSLSGYLCFFLFYPCNLYWYVLLAPFLVLVVYTYPQNIRINLLLETVYGLMTGLWYGYGLSWWVQLGPKTFSYLFLKGYTYETEENAIQIFIREVLHSDWSVYLPIFKGIAYAGICMLLILNFPMRIRKNAETDIDLNNEIKTITWLRIGIIYVWIFIGAYGLLRM